MASGSVTKLDLLMFFCNRQSATDERIVQGRWAWPGFITIRDITEKSDIRSFLSQFHPLTTDRVSGVGGRMRRIKWCATQVLSVKSLLVRVAAAADTKERWGPACAKATQGKSHHQRNKSSRLGRRKLFVHQWRWREYGGVEDEGQDTNKTLCLLALCSSVS